MESLEFEWEVLREPQNPGEFRLVTYQNLTGRSVAAIVVPVLRRAYNLADGWRIQGLQGLAATRPGHMLGGWAAATKSHRPPALTTMMFEVAPGKVSRRTADGGWVVKGD